MWFKIKLIICFLKTIPHVKCEKLPVRNSEQWRKQKSPV